MTLIIFSCKLFIESKKDLSVLNKGPSHTLKGKVGKYIIILLKKYLSLWETSSSFWIYNILIFGLVFVLFSAYNILRVLMFFNQT